MKKILLLIVSGLLIACMAGSAMAIGLSANMPIDPVTKLPYVTLVPSSGLSSGGLTFTVDPGFEGSYTFSVEVLEGTDLKARILDLNGQSMGDWEEISNPEDQTFTGFSSGDYPCTLQVKGTSAGKIRISAVGPDDSESQDVSIKVKTEIPEFQTVALPVAAVIGLVFIIGRKKEGL